MITYVTFIFIIINKYIHKCKLCIILYDIIFFGNQTTFLVETTAGYSAPVRTSTESRLHHWVFRILERHLGFWSVVSEAAQSQKSHVIAVGSLLDRRGSAASQV